MKEYKVKVFENGTKEWWLHGKLHREDGPAVEYTDGREFWYLDGEPHREDGPAMEFADGCKYWFLHGKMHREDGPAVDYPDGDKEWWLNGKNVTEKEHKRRTAGVTMDDALAAGDAVILREQAKRIAGLESQNRKLVNALEILMERIGSDERFAHWSKIAKRAIAKAKGE